MARATTSGAASGFTLVEMLVALAVLGALTLVALAMFRIGSGLWAATARTEERLAEIATVQDLLRQVLERAYPAVIAAPDGYIVAFTGTAKSLEFSASLPAAVGLGGLRRLRLGSDGDSVVMTSRLERNAPQWEQLPEPEQRFPLLANVRSLDLDYYGAKPGSAAHWHAEWLALQKLPQLVRIKVTFADGRLSWPALLAAPQITVDATCVFDALTRQCRGR